MSETQYFISVLGRSAAEVNGIVQIEAAEHDALRASSGRIERFVQQQSFALVARNFNAMHQAFEVGRRPRTNSSPVAAMPLYEEVRHAVLSWLLATRLFLDHTQHEIHTRFGPASPELGAWDSARQSEHANHVGYRVLYALRDFISHRGMPPLNMNLAVRSSGENEFAVTLRPQALLAESFDWKAHARADLKNLGDEVDIEGLAEEYMGCLDRLAHVALRLLAPTLLEDAQHVTAAAQRVAGIDGHPAVVAFTFDADGHVTHLSPSTLPKAWAAWVLEEFGIGS